MSTTKRIKIRPSAPLGATGCAYCVKNPRPLVFGPEPPYQKRIGASRVQTSAPPSPARAVLNSTPDHAPSYGERLDQEGKRERTGPGSCERGTVCRLLLLDLSECRTCGALSGLARLRIGKDLGRIARGLLPGGFVLGHVLAPVDRRNHRQPERALIRTQLSTHSVLTNGDRRERLWMAPEIRRRS